MSRQQEIFVVFVAFVLPSRRTILLIHLGLFYVFAKWNHMMARQMQQSAADIYDALYLFYTSLWAESSAEMSIIDI